MVWFRPLRLSQISSVAFTERDIGQNQRLAWVQLGSIAFENRPEME